MTVARLNRGKTKFIVGVVALLLVLGFVAIFQNNQQENDELREMSIRCEQQLGGMQAQSSRASMEFKKLNVDFEKKVDELEKLQEELKKTQEELSEQKQQVQTLEQASRLSETHRDDETERLKKENSNLKEQIDHLHKEKDKEVAMLKARLENEENAETVSQLKQQTIRLEQELAHVREKCYSGGAGNYEASSLSIPAHKSVPSVEANFNQQMIPKQIVVDEPRGVLAQPQLLNVKSPSSSSSTTTTESAAKSAADKEKLDAPPILQAPLKGSSTSTAATKKMDVPEGVVPFVETNLLEQEDSPGGVVDNRYNNAVDDLTNNNSNNNAFSKKGEDEVKVNQGDDLNFLNGHDEDNMGNEVPDNDFNIEEKKKPADAGENNAEEDTNLYDANKGIFINPAKEGEAHKKGDDLKLRHEVIDDQGKEGDNEYHNDDVHLDAQQEEGGDTDDYDVPDRNVNAPDVVVRN